MIEVQELSRRYGDFTAVDGISFEVGDGEIVGLLGPNGAGKTTTIRMITGYLPPTAGAVRVAGMDLAAEPAKAKRQIGYLPETVALYPEMRVVEYLAYRARLEGMSRSEAKTAIAETLERCLIEDVRGQIIGTLSKGYRQRIGLAAAIIHGPEVLVLDEPTVGLDPKQIIAIRDLIRELGGTRTLLLSTHILPEVELLCNRVVIIDGGRIVDQGTPDSLRRRWRGQRQITVGLKGSPDGAVEGLAGLPGVGRVEALDGHGRLRLDCDADHDPREAVFRLAVERGWVLLELAERKASLEDLFVRLTTRDGGAEEGASVAADAAIDPDPESAPATAGEEEIS